ncbi:hypothetical protein BDY19DRAFT_347928 [Irpex rosettiformis]|uniref:Uncharacterized protein n=1 Tax=Irpex rosettiformis TaxID=378272 RepID=A0ACB8TX46_9APHY|nr:hypothetical protein BDY19DRAFT_347928 [Irpex rosettiformis]
MVPSSLTSSRRPSAVAGPSMLPPPPSPRVPPQPRPRGSSRSRPQPPPPPTQPTTVKLSPSALRSFPHRLAHPPMPPLSGDSHTCAKGKERAKWWSGWSLRIQPEYDVKLEDVLDRKHLPPLGLKDFEEWLVFVEGTPENLYFILWLREYTTRYTAWMMSLRSKQSLRISSSQPNPLTASTQLAIPSARGRPLTSLDMAISSLSLPPPSPQRSPAAPYPTYPTYPSPSSSYPTAPTRVEDDPAVEENSHRGACYRTLYTPSPNPDLAIFYLRAKETFLTPVAEYELDVTSDVLSKFHVSSSTGERKTRRDSGVAFRDRDREHERERRGSHGWEEDIKFAGNSAPDRAGLGMTGTNVYPPDPAVFDELADIVQERLRASLKRLVVATYNNVGMPRAYCGSAGGCTIALITSAPPIIASFAAGGPRWYRLLALPGLWLGMTIFISAMYGVCMMIYVFGDLRQLRSFELARPPPGTADANFKPPATKDTISTSPIGASLATPSQSFASVSHEKDRRGSVFTLGRSLMGKTKSEDKLPPNVARYSPEAGGELTFRKESLVPVPNPVLRLPMPGRPKTAHIAHKSGSVGGGTSVRTTSRSPPASPVEVEGEGEIEKPKLRLDIWGGGEGAAGGSDAVQVPPKAIVRDRREEIGPTVVISSGDEEESGDELESDDHDDDIEEDEDNYDSGFDTGSEADGEHGSSPYVVSSNPTRHRHRHRHRHQKEPSLSPPIEISDAFYDENPSPEGPATAPADWFPQNLERLAARNPVPDPSTVQSEHPLWPDYSQTQEEYEHNARRTRNETALFIAPFSYDGNESGSSCAHNSADGIEGEKERDVEKGETRISPDDEIRQVQAAQPMYRFYFGGLPSRKPKLPLRVGTLI